MTPEPARLLLVYLAPGTPETGLWCDTCLLPSAIRFPLLILGENGVYEVGRMTLCTECDPPGDAGTGELPPS